MQEALSHFSKLAALAKQTTSEERRELLRTVSDALAESAQSPDCKSFGELDDLLATVAADYSVEIRAELAELVASSSHFVRATEQFALDDIKVAEPILTRSRILNDATLLKVIGTHSQRHMMAVTRRPDISPAISKALVESGNDDVVVSLLANEGAQIEYETFERLAKRAETSSALQFPFVRRKDAPLELLNDLYTKVEAGIRREIVQKFQSVSPEELEKAFARSRQRVSSKNTEIIQDYGAATHRIDALVRSGNLSAASLIPLLREGPQSRTAFIIAFARLTDIELEFSHRIVTAHDLDTIALLCRGAGFERAIYITLAVALKKPEDRMDIEQLGHMYEDVPVLAAQRAIRFWKVRTGLQAA